MHTNPTLPLPPLPGPDAALFLDIDGTLLDLARRPELVVVPAELPGLLRQISASLDGALALVTGRDLPSVDGIGQGSRPFDGLSVAAEHGALIRQVGDAAPVGSLPEPLPAWRQAADDFGARHEKAVVEQKRFGIVLHVREAPEAADEARALIESFIPEGQGHFRAVPAHAAVELRPVMADKGRVLLRLMEGAPFAGRQPVFIGDDVTDEDGMAAARSLGGFGYHVGRDFGGETANVRAWLAEMAKRLTQRVA
ncbi:trehalose-phosphatase [Acetobacteraceae bacterium H6797]|nr:trehalose-phosphatase [Acetobacteraceae bacterium H6797]